MDSFLGKDTGLKTSEQVISSLKKSKFLSVLNDAEMKQLLGTAEELYFEAGSVVAVANSSTTNKIFLVKTGELLAVAADLALPDGGVVNLAKLAGSERARLLPGQVFNDKALNSPETATLEASLVAAVSSAVIAFTTSDVEKIVGGRTTSRARVAGGDAPKFPRVRFAELEMHRIIGTGQFGLVRVVRNIKSDEVYALKVMHKAPITESKQIEHVLNERRILEEASHPFCVRLCGAYQDRNSLYLLQVRKGSGVGNGVRVQAAECVYGIRSCDRWPVLPRFIT